MVFTQSDCSAIQSETSRLSLRSMLLGDESILFPCITIPLTKDWIGWEPPESMPALSKAVNGMVAASRLNEELALLAFSKESGDFIGFCGISKTPEFGEHEIGVWVKESEQGKGYATEMVNWLIDWAKEHLELEWIVYSVTQGNKGSQRIADKLKLPLYRVWHENKRGIKRVINDYRINLADFK